jgi:hypothetical protein
LIKQCHSEEETPLEGRVINNKTIEQINTNNYWGYTVSYEREKYVINELTKLLRITGIVSQVLKLHNP